MLLNECGISETQCFWSSIFFLEGLRSINVKKDLKTEFNIHVP